METHPGGGLPSNEHFERMRGEIKRVEEQMKKLKEQILGFPKSIIQFGLFLKNFTNGIEGIYVKDSEYHSVGIEIGDTFTSCHTCYTEVVSFKKHSFSFSIST
jgi:hypothetical protein